MGPLIPLLRMIRKPEKCEIALGTSVGSDRNMIMLKTAFQVALVLRCGGLAGPVLSCVLQPRLCRFNQNQ
jgi:hypothetical protein